jgi:hypothetical protein
MKLRRRSHHLRAVDKRTIGIFEKYLQDRSVASAKASPLELLDFPSFKFD